QSQTVFDVFGIYYKSSKRQKHNENNGEISLVLELYKELFRLPMASNTCVLGSQYEILTGDFRTI
ncbi:hypothetical protein STEG23_018520, partial [Scotinomys teguina]